MKMSKESTAGHTRDRESGIIPVPNLIGMPVSIAGAATAMTAVLSPGDPLTAALLARIPSDAVVAVINDGSPHLSQRSLKSFLRHPQNVEDIMGRGSITKILPSEYP